MSKKCTGCETASNKLRCTENRKSFKLNNWLTAGVMLAVIGAVVAYYFMK